MENKSGGLSDLQQTLTNNFQQLTNLSLSMVKPVADAMVNNMSAVSNSMLNTTNPLFKIPLLQQGDCDCCPPKQTCPPHCIAAITRTAMEGERIIVPFQVKNGCNQTKTYRIGVRELKEEESGQMAPFQPMLSKTVVTLDPGRSEQISMTIDLNNFKTGSTYATEIVLREKEINQNICFTLSIGNANSVPVVTPKDEQQYRLRWQSWKDHYYCEKPTLTRTGGTTIPSQLPGK